MSDDEDASHSEEEDEEEEEEEEEKEQQRSEEDEEVVEKKEESEAEKAMKKRRETQRQETTGLDETAKELLESNRHEREQMENEIQELRRRNERRKKEREIEEKRLAAERAAEDERRKAAEEAKRRMKFEEEEKRQKERAKKMAEFEKWKNPPKPNFVITKRSGSAEPGDDDDDDEEEEKGHEGKGRKSKEQLEAEKRAILQQRIKPLEIQGFDAAKLAEKAKELHSLIFRLEGEKYDLEKQFKAQQFDMMELAERARQANKVGKGGLKRLQPGPDDSVDRIQERFAGAPAKIEMYSKYERQKDKRTYDERLNLFTGPQFLYPAERIKASKLITWNEEGVPVYAGGGEDGGHGPTDAAPAAGAAEE